MNREDPAQPPPAIDDAMLRAYLTDQLPGDEMARIERGLRESAALRSRLEDVRDDREDIQIHTLGAIWRRSRLTCPTRQQLGSYLLEALDPALASYFQFHLEVVECPFCQANFADLESQNVAPSVVNASLHRQQRILKSSEHLLGDEGA